MQNLDRLDDFDYPEIPKLYEEALLLYTSHTQKPVNLRGRQVSWQTHQRTQNFSNILRRLHSGGEKAIASDKQARLAAFNELAEDYGDTYLFYYFFGLSGMKQ